MTGGCSRVLLTPRTRWTATNAVPTMRDEAGRRILTGASRAAHSGQKAATPTAAVTTSLTQFWRAPCSALSPIAG